MSIVRRKAAGDMERAGVQSTTPAKQRRWWMLPMRVVVCEIASCTAGAEVMSTASVRI